MRTVKIGFLLALLTSVGIFQSSVTAHADGWPYFLFPWDHSTPVPGWPVATPHVATLAPATAKRPLRHLRPRLVAIHTSPHQGCSSALCGTYMVVGLGF